MGKTSENVIAAAKEGELEALRDAVIYGTGYMVDGSSIDPRVVMIKNEEPKVSDLERVARAIAVRRGFNPDSAATNWTPYRIDGGIWLMPPDNAVRPLWTFFTAEADAALSVLDI